MKPIGKVLSLFTLACCCAVAPADAPVDTDSTQTYDQLRERALSGNKNTDYYQLRRAWAKSKYYQPYSTVSNSLLASAKDMAESGLHRLCVSRARQLLGIDWPNIEVHYLLSSCHQSLGNSSKAARHRSIALGLLSSIDAVGSGTSPNDSWKILDTREIYDYAKKHNYSVQVSNAIAGNEEQYYIYTTFTDRNNREFGRWFDASEAYLKQFGDVIRQVQKRAKEAVREEAEANQRF